ncbi:MAG: ATP-binding protein [Deltaproteobacteria bacterium]|nr:ATP-binding protein [Deltaproteobacteria bacterium]
MSVELFAVLAVVAGCGAALYRRRARRLAAALAEAEMARARVEEQVRQRERFTDALIAHSSDLISILNPDGTIRFASPSHARVLGWQPAELVGTNAFALVHPDDQPALLEAFSAGVGTPDVTVTREYRIRHRDGGWRVVESRARAALDDPVIAGAVISSRDITERRRVERDKAALLEMAHDIAGTLDLQAVLDRVGQRTVRVVPCDGVATAHWDAAAGVFRVLATLGVPEPLASMARQLTFPRGMGLGGRMSDGETVVLYEPATHEDPFLQLLGGLGVSAFVSTPLVVRGRLVGGFWAFKQQGRFHPPQVQLIESIGRQLAMAVEAADLYAAQREEAAVAAALARLGRELISELDGPALLERLCRITVEELGCDVSRTYLRDLERDEYRAVASAGDTPEQWEALRVLTFSSQTLAPFVGELARRDVVQLDIGGRVRGDDPLHRGADRARVLAMALRRGGELIGIHAARYFNRQAPCSPSQERIAGGIAQLASLALENARLVAELDRADRVKSDFVASMSHELRTPLNVIIGYSDLLADQVFGELAAEQADTVRRIGEQGRELLELVNTTLDMSRLESGRIPLAVQQVDLVALLSEIELEVHLVRRQASLRLVWNVPGDLPALATDPIKLKVVVKNLLLNAIKFTDEGTITLSAACRDGGVEIRIADTGIGIAADMLPHIFEPFRQAAQGNERRGGVGLGLHIVRRLLDMLDGEVDVVSEPGRGSTFRVWIPLRAETPELEVPERVVAQR